VPPKLVTLAVVGSAACGGYPPAPAYPGDPDDFRPVPVREPAGLDHDPPRPLTLHAGDIVTVTTVSQETAKFEGLVVDETGRIHVPLAGDVEVGNIPLSQAEERLQETLQTFDRFVRVTITVTDPAGQRATVLGAVANPGQVQVPPGLRLADLVARVGGPLTATGGEGVPVHRMLADLGGARLYREGELVPVSLERALRGDPRHNVRIRAGDHLYVPARPLDRLVVLGAVNAGSVLPHREGIRLTEALAQAGGVTIDADIADIRVIRGDLASPTVYEASLDDIKDGDSHDVVLEPGDIVYVTDHWIADFGEVLDRLGPILSTAVTVGLTTAIIVTQ
jgi:polysaccharide export outer membrane protein